MRRNWSWSDYDYDAIPNFEDLVGKTLRSVTKEKDELIRFESNDGTVYDMFHCQCCCEHVYIESVIGDLDDLVGTPILVAEEATSRKLPGPEVEPDVDDYVAESQTWTFYKLRTIKGSVDIRWYGTSNGYYSESVNFYRLAQRND